MLGKKSKLAKTVLVFFGLVLNSALISANDNICSIEFDELVFEGLNTHPSINVSKKILIGADLQLSSAKWGYYPTPTIDVSKSLIIIPSILAPTFLTFLIDDIKAIVLVESDLIIKRL